MKQYIIGALFRNNFTEVLLIEKQKPEWQKGLLNFPGGKIEEGERPAECASREFVEEAALNIPVDLWHSIGEINGNGYNCYFLTALYDEAMGQAKSMEIEQLHWVYTRDLPENTISILYWLVPFAINYHTQGNGDNVYGKFQYADIQ